MEVIIGILIPFIGTCCGSLLVFFLKNDLKKNIENIILGFASGVMVAASIWSLIIPAINICDKNMIPVVIGLSLGIVLFCLSDKLTKKKDSSDLFLAVTIHNIPEGMAVGIAFSSYLVGICSLTSCMVLAIGIAIQNIPEGSIISLPLYKQGLSKNRAFFKGVLSALFELGGAIITLMFTRIVTFLFPVFLSFAAGAMFYVVIHELIPESSDGSNSNTIGYLIGFLVMMLLDVYLG